MTERHDLDSLLAESAWVRSLARSLTRSDADADDLVQDAWTAALRRPPTADRPLRPWLAAVVRNAARARFRSSSRREAREDETRRREDDVPAPEALLGELELQEQLSALVRALPEPQRESVVLRYHEGLSGAEIARRLGVPAGTVRWRLKSGLDALRAELDKRHGGDRSAWLGALAPLARPRGAATVASAAGFAFAVKTAVAAAAAVAAYVFVLAPLLDATSGRGGGLTAGGGGEGTDVARLVDETEAEVELEAPAAVETQGERSAEAEGDDPDAEPAAVDTRLRLRVVDPDGAPIAGARVEVQPGLEAMSAVRQLFETMSNVERLALQAEFTKQTDGAGEARFSSPLLRVDSTAEVVVTGPRNGIWSSNVALSPGDDLDLGNVVLEPRGRVFGVLRDARGLPTRGTVVLRRADVDSSMADVLARSSVGEGGRYELLLDTTATVRLEAGHDDGELEAFDTATVELGTSVQLDARLSVDVVESVPPRLIARGPGGERIDAFFEIEILGRGTVATTTQARDDDLFPNAQFLDREGNTLVRIKAIDRSLRHRPTTQEFRPPFEHFELTLDAVPTRSLRIEIVGPGGKAVDDPLLDLSILDSRLSLDAARLADAVELPLVDDELLDASARGDRCIPLEIEGLHIAELPDPWRIQLERLPGIVGRVTFDGEPVSRPRIKASHRCDPGEWNRRRNGLEAVRWSSGWDARGARDGTFELPLQWDGEWVLRVRARGFADALVDLSGYDPSVGIDLGEIELERPGEVSGRVFDGAGEPRAGARVVASHAEHESRVARTKRDGTYRFDDLPAGDWAIFAPLEIEGGSWTTILDLGADYRLPTNVTVTSGSLSTLDLADTTRPVSIGFAVEGGAIAPDAFVSVGLEAGGGDPRLVFEARQQERHGPGTVEFDLPEAVAISVSLRSESFQGRATWDADLADAGDAVTLPLPLGEITVTGPADARVVLRGTPVAPGAPASYCALTLDETGVVGPVKVVAGEIEVELRGDDVPRRSVRLEAGARERVRFD